MVRNTQPKSIMIRCPNWVGDLIMATPVFECLRQNFPEARIAAITRAYNAKVIAGDPNLDEIVPCNDRGLEGLRQTAAAIRQAEPDWMLLLPNSMRAYFPAKMGGAKELIGYRRGTRKLFVNGPEPELDENGKFLPMPMIDYYLNLCKWLKLKVQDAPKPILHVSAELQKNADERLAKLGINVQDQYICLNPGAKFGSSKCWPPEHFARLADLLEDELKHKLLLLVGPGEDEIAREIMGKTRSTLISTANEIFDLAELKPVIKRSTLLITNDTGPRHYATAFDVPVVVIMGPTDPRWTNSNLDHTIVLRKQLACAPCHKKVCEGNHECMSNIQPEEVLAAVRKLLG